MPRSMNPGPMPWVASRPAGVVARASPVGEPASTSPCCVMPLHLECWNLECWPDRRPACQHNGLRRDGFRMPQRSEEHTSELQSLMRISYAVFCLKKKKKQIRMVQRTVEHTSGLKQVHNISTAS